MLIKCEAMAKSTLDRLRAGREQMAERCQEVARALVGEAGVTDCMFHDKGLRGRAWPRERRILVPRPTTRRRLYVLAHECGHVALGDIKPVYRGEYLAEMYAHKALRRHGIAIPREATISAKKYVSLKIRRALRRRVKEIDSEVSDWCGDYLWEDLRRHFFRGPG